MGISWTTALLDQDQSLEGLLARNKLQDDSRFKLIAQTEDLRAQKQAEAHAAQQLAEQTRLREAQQAETNRRNTEVSEDREIAQFMTALGLLEPGSMADPKMVETATKRGLGDLFEGDPEKKTYKFKGTASQLRAKEREAQAEERARLAEERERRMADAQERHLRLQSATLENQVARTKIQEARERRMAQANQNVMKLTSQQQIAFRTVLKDMQEKAKEASGGLFGLGIFGAEEEQDATLKMVEQAYMQVTGSPVLSPKAPTDDTLGSGKPTHGESKPSSSTAPAPQPRVIAPGITVIRRQ
jgi:hypothetical protein